MLTVNYTVINNDLFNINTFHSQGKQCASEYTDSDTRCQKVPVSYNTSFLIKKVF